MGRGDISEEMAHLCVENIKDMEDDKCLKVNDVIKIKRFYIKKMKDYEQYQDRAKVCFPNLVFHEDAFHDVQKLG